MKLKIVFISLTVLFLNACNNNEPASQQGVPDASTVIQEKPAPVAPSPIEPPTVEITKPQQSLQPAVAAVSEPVSGEAIYKKTCIGCHASGAANAPKPGDKAAWKPRIAKGMNALLQSALNGVPATAMMKRGSCATCSDAELQAAVEYMVSQSR